MKIAFIISHSELLALWVMCSEYRVEADLDYNWEHVPQGRTSSFEQDLQRWISEDDDHSFIQFDNLEEAIEYANQHYPHPIRASKLLLELV